MPNTTFSLKNIKINKVNSLISLHDYKFSFAYLNSHRERLDFFRHLIIKIRRDFFTEDINFFTITFFNIRFKFDFRKNKLAQYEELATAIFEEIKNRKVKK